MKKFLSILAIALAVITTSCKKPAGEGGNSFIKGNVHTTNWNATFTVINAEYPSPDADVYIIYGDEATYGDKLKTGPDGVYEFKYLRPGSYTIYAYSKDKEAFLAGNNNPPEKAVFIDVEITKKKQTVDAPTIEIIR